MRDSTTIQMVEELAAGAADGIAESYKLARLVKERVTAWENILANRPGGPLWALLTLPIFSRKKLMAKVEAEHDRISNERLQKTRAAAAKASEQLVIPMPGIIDPKRMRA